MTTTTTERHAELEATLHQSVRLYRPAEGCKQTFLIASIKYFYTA
jgi:hypothetical protein